MYLVPEDCTLENNQDGELLCFVYLTMVLKKQVKSSTAYRSNPKRTKDERAAMRGTELPITLGSQAGG